MLIVLIIFAVPLLAAFICGVAIGRSGREALRVEIHRLRELYAATKAVTETLESGTETLRRIAENALEVAKQKHFPPEHDETARQVFPDRSKGWVDAVNSVARSMPNYIPPQEKHCPECSVSVRAESWPMECPACHCMFGFEE